MGRGALVKIASAKRVLLVVAGLAAVVGIGATVSAASTKPDFAVTASPHAMSVERGNHVHFDVAMTRSNGFHGDIALTVSGLPAGASGTFSASPYYGDSHRSLTVSTSSQASPGSSTLTITGTNGSLKHTAQVVLTTTKAPAPSFKLAVAPANRNLSAGTSGDYTVTITRTQLTASIAFTAAGIPAHASATFSPSATTGNSTTLNVHTASNTPLGSYTLTIKGQSGSYTATVTAHLTVSAGHAQAFTIAGSLDRTLAPDVTGYLNLALTNSNNQPMSITNLTVTISGTNKPACATSNFAVTQFSGAYTFSVPANSTKTLTQLGIPQSAWPKIKMINLSTNQDACKSTNLSLSYTGTGQGN
jgi:hypothetical protein